VPGLGRLLALTVERGGQLLRLPSRCWSMAATGGDLAATKQGRAFRLGWEAREEWK